MEERKEQRSEGVVFGLLKLVTKQGKLKKKKNQKLTTIIETLSIKRWVGAWKFKILVDCD